MKTIIFITFALIFLAFPLTGHETVFADETYLVQPYVSYPTIRFNNDNWGTLPHPKIAEFTMRDDGSAYGLTENGISFIQYNVPNSIGIRVQRFEIQDHYHYIVEGQIADDLEELSARLALAYSAHTGA